MIYVSDLPPPDNPGHDTPNPEPDNTKPLDPPPSLPWRPSYLHRTILASFMLIFILFTVAIEILLFVSNKYYGIATTSSQHYKWTYGPTALLTLVAAGWNRVSYQCKLIAPWVRLSKQGPGSGDSQVTSSQTVLLDYVSTFEPWVIFKAFSNRDFTVLLSSMVSLLIKVLIVVSTGLVTFSLTKVTYDPYLIVIQDRFLDSRDVSIVPGTLPFMVISSSTECMSNHNFPPPSFQITHLTRGIIARRRYCLAGRCVSRLHVCIPIRPARYPGQRGDSGDSQWIAASLECSTADVGLVTGSGNFEYREVVGTIEIPGPNFTARSPDCSIETLAIPYTTSLTYKGTTLTPELLIFHIVDTQVMEPKEPPPSTEDWQY